MLCFVAVPRELLRNVIVWKRQICNFLSMRKPINNCTVYFKQAVYGQNLTWGRRPHEHAHCAKDAAHIYEVKFLDWVDVVLDSTIEASSQRVLT
jgi:hypothetical protein